ncbi:MAG: prenyltransferase/squalene oxidase repeat-containing protein [Chitinophagaceae bacterium]
MSLEPVQDALAVLVMNGSANEEGSEMQAFDVEAAAPSMSQSEETSDMIPDASPSLSVSSDLNTEVRLDATIGAGIQVASLSSVSQQLTPSDMMVASVSGSLSKSLSSRTGTAKRDMLEKYGGNKDSEKSVALALQWLAAHQLPDGGWAFGHSVACGGKCDHPGTEDGRNGATGLAIMTFLGAGQTHLEGEYKKTVHRGINFLMQTMDVKGGELPSGSWHGKGDNMYGHGIASIAMCEAYAMSHDPALAKPAQLSLNFISLAQSPNAGGWDYSPRGGNGDTSIVGWQLMALKSGTMGGLVVRTPTLKNAERFLDSVQMNKGAFYGYRTPDTNINGRLATSVLVDSFAGCTWDGPKPTRRWKKGLATLPRKAPIQPTFISTTMRLK